jgi:hypothetical protein
MHRHNRIHFIVLVTMAFVIGCAPLLPSVASLPTSQPGAVNTFVAGTRQAAITQTQYFVTPSATPSLTRTPSKTPTLVSPTATFIFTPYKTPIPTKKGGGGGSGNGNGNGNGNGGGGGPDEPPGGVVVIGLDIYYCEVISVSPASGGTYSPGAVIGTITWTVKNIGNVDWNPKGPPNDPAHPNIDLVWMSGSKLSTYTIYDTPHDKIILPGQTVDLTIGIPNTKNAPAKPAKAPTKPGKYVVHWALRIGYEEFCRDMEFKFTVE